MFISDNGPCARGDGPSHVLEEKLQMSPATQALPFALIGVKCSLNPRLE